MDLKLTSNCYNLPDKFEVWKKKSGHENIYAKDAELLIDELFNISDSTVEDEINEMLLLINSSKKTDYKSTAWQFEQSSYNSVSEAHLQFLIMWGFQKSCNLIGLKIDLEKSFPIIIRVIKSIQLSPYVVKEDNCYYIVLPTYFFRVINMFLDSHTEIENQGSKFAKASSDTTIKTNYIGGKSIELAIINNFKKAVETVENFKGLVPGIELFHDLIGFDFDFEKGGFPIYFPDFVMKSMMEISNDFGTYSGNLGHNIDKNNKHYLYITTVFLVFHELSHISLGHITNASKTTRNIKDEIEADKFGYYLYTDFANSQLAKQQNEIAEALKFICGPAIYFETFSIFELTKQCFYYEDEAKRNLLAQSFIELKNRKAMFKELLKSTLTDESFSDNERGIIQSILQEYEVLETLLLMIGSQMINRKVINFESATIHKNENQVLEKIFP